MKTYLIRITARMSVEIEAENMSDATKMAVSDVEDVCNQHDWDWEEVIGEDGELLDPVLEL